MAVSRDPWRYACPSCGSVSMIKRSSHGSGDMHGGNAINRYYCDNCNHGSDRVVDKKTGKLVA